MTTHAATTTATVEKVGVRRVGETSASLPCRTPSLLEREDKPGSADDAGERAAERRDHRAERDDVPDPGRDVSRAQIADQRRGGDECLHPAGRGAEAHRLDGGHDHEVDAAEDRDAEDCPRDVLVRMLGLLTKRGGRLEAGEGQESEHDAEEDRRESECRRAG